ncbi:MAG: ATP-binding cassette domain-containing protein [Bryobacterales bacterium]|nr:ATP-binding cassette domain-containing protein [Bryobacterales bacterium]
MSEHSAVIEARDLRVYYEEGAFLRRRRWVAGPISFHVHENEFVGLAGPSGSGKTSLGKALLNLIPTWEGDVYWMGRNIRQTSLRVLRSRFGWISQEPTLVFNPRRRIIDTLRETLMVGGSAKCHQRQIAHACDLMNLDPALAGRYPFELSAGQVQRFALARVLMLEPKFLLLDEPTSSLDPMNQAQILDRVLEWRRRYGLAAVVIAHSHRLLTRMCDRILTLENRA